MRIVALLIDRKPAYLSAAGGQMSLLQTPLGARTILGHLCGEIDRLNLAAEIFVMPAFAVDDAYALAIRRICPRSSVAFASAICERVRMLEPSDLVLVVDPRHFPTRGFDLGKLLLETENHGCTSHFVALRAPAEGTQEQILTDGNGQVRRIQRYYNGITYVAVAGTAASLIPAATLSSADARQLLRPEELRRALAAQGSPSRDVLLPDGMFDLTIEGELLCLSDRSVRCFNSSRTNGSGTIPGGILTGGGTHISPTGRILGSVVIHSGVVIERDALIVGPTVLGAGCRIGRAASIAHCVVFPEARVPAGVTVQGRVISGRLTDLPAEARSRSQKSAFAVPNNGPDHLLRANCQSCPVARRAVYPRIKHVLETGLALLAVILFGPVLLAAAALVRLTSPGPAMFTEIREGRGGKLFRCWKFRTMVDGAHALQRGLYKASVVDGPQFKLEHDPRITRIGHWLRSSNIDELPQLFNVISGDMSLVGPRPSPFRENQICVPWRDARLSVRPGITGLWQLCRTSRSSGDFHQWIHFDTLYVQNMSLWLDIKLLAATAISLGGRRSCPLSWFIRKHKVRKQAVRGRVPITVPTSFAYDALALGTGRGGSDAQVLTETSDSGAVRPGRSSGRGNANRAAAAGAAGAAGKPEGEGYTAPADPQEYVPEMEG